MSTVAELPQASRTAVASLLHEDSDLQTGSNSFEIEYA